MEFGDSESLSNVYSNTAVDRVEMSVWIASSTLLIYDYCCTFRTEVEYVWKPPRARFLGFLLFYLNRYLPFFDIAFAIPIRFFELYEDAFFLITITAWTGVIGMLVSQIIIYLRTYAIWHRERFVLIILSILLTAVLTAMVVILVLQTREGFKFQASFSTSYKLLAFYISIVIGELVVVTLTLVKACKHSSYTSAVWVKQLYRNGILFCCCMLTVNIINIVMIFAAPASMKVILISLQRNLHSILCNRVIFLILKHAPGMGGRDSYINRNNDEDFTMAIFTTIQDDTLTVSSYPRSTDSRGWPQQEWIT